MKPFSLLTLFLFPLFSFTQHAEVSNLTPQRGETIYIYYTPDSASKFTLEDEVYVRLAPNYENYSSDIEVMKMSREEKRFILSYKIPQGLSAAEVYIKSLDGYDRNVTLTIQVKDSEGKLYRNGQIPVLFDSPEKYQDELAAFPDNYTVYRYRWQVMPYTNKDSASIIIDQELEQLAKKGKKNEALYYALTCGYAQRGNFDNARKSFLSLLKKHPDSHLITDAHSYYSYQLFSHSEKDTILTKKILEFIKKYPETALAKENISALYKKEVLTDSEALLNILTYWMEKEPDNAILYYHYANTLESQADKLSYYNKALNTFLNGDLVVKNNYTWDSSLPYSIYRLAKAFRQNDAPGQALLVSQMIEDNYPEKEAYFVLQKGRILQDLHRYKEAMETYLQAANMGVDAATDSARAVFANQGYHGDFEEFALNYRKKQFYNEEVSAAPSFKVEDLEGNSYKLEDLKGKVVVLNFWFIGCAPCRIEMPGLNEMVKEYEGKEVVFLAFALDSKESLEEFLKTNEFAYRVIPSATHIANLYEAEGFPTHVIIDKEGNIRSTLVGGSPDRHENIKPLIDRALAF